MRAFLVRVLMEQPYGARPTLDFYAADASVDGAMGLVRRETGARGEDVQIVRELSQPEIAQLGLKAGEVRAI